MNLAYASRMLPIADYLEGEQHSPIRHEYLAGEVYAMAGAGEAHNRISLNLAFHLRLASRGSACGVFISDMKLRVEHNDSFYYPDVLLTCNPQDTHTLFKTSPCLLAEVTSPSTETIDRREKLLAYRRLPGLQHYLIIAQDQRRVEWHQRDALGHWLLALLEGQGRIDIDCPPVRASFTLDDLYEDVSLA
jgi:Uma2 family endonuclease